jgi:hypothetical protein
MSISPLIFHVISKELINWLKEAAGLFAQDNTQCATQSHKILAVGRGHAIKHVSGTVDKSDPLALGFLVCGRVT